MFNSMAGHEEKTTLTKSIDIESSIHFQILGQADTVSAWHIDHISPYTYVTLELNLPDDQAAQDSVLKLFLVVKTDHLPRHEYDNLMQQFQKEHQNFTPTPDLIRIICLKKGDTLIMPRAQSTRPSRSLTVYSEGNSDASKPAQAQYEGVEVYCGNKDKTNRKVPKQTRSVKGFFKRRVQQDPTSNGDEDGGSFVFGRSLWNTVLRDPSKSFCISIFNLAY
jgi:hypothetical protein